MLAHPYYIGIVRYGGAQYEGRHEPLVDKDTFSRVQAVLAAHNNAKEKDRKHHHYLKGSLVCGKCGSRMTFVKARGKLGGIYPYFACIGRIKRTGCRQPYIAADGTEAKVALEYGRMKFKQIGAETTAAWVGHIDDVREKLHQAIAGMQEQNVRTAARQRRRIAGIKSRQRKAPRCVPGRLPANRVAPGEADRARKRTRPKPSTT